MALRIISIEEKLAAIERAINVARRCDRPPGSLAQQHYEALKEIGKDLRARGEFPRSNTLGELARLLQRAKDAPRDGQFFNSGKMIAVANFVVGRWATISQALERFGEESCE